MCDAVPVKMMPKYVITPWEIQASARSRHPVHLIETMSDD